MPGYRQNLISVKKLNDNGVRVEFGSQPKQLMTEDGTTFPFIRREDLFVIQVFRNPDNMGQCWFAQRGQWHRGLGRNNIRDEPDVEGQVQRVKIQPATNSGVCDELRAQKANRADVTKTLETRAGESLDIVHTDTSESKQTETTEDKQYEIELRDTPIDEKQVEVQVEAIGGVREESSDFDDRGIHEPIDEERRAETPEDGGPTIIQQQQTKCGDTVCWDQLDSRTEAPTSCIAGVAESQVPTNTEEAVGNSRRRRAVDAERNSLLNKAWELERLPPEEQAIDGNLHNTVQLGSDRAGAQCVTRQYAKQSAGDKLEDIHMRWPMGLEQQGRSEAPLVCGLLKSLYGLKHSGIFWYDKRCQYLKEQTSSDPCVQTHKKARPKELAGT